MKNKVLPLLLVLLIIFASGCAKENDLAETSASTMTSTVTSTEIQSTKNSAEKSTEISTKTARENSTASTAKTETTSAEEITKSVKKTAASKAEETVTCTVTISCKTILGNMKNLKPEKEMFVPADGIILEKATLKLEKGSTAFDALKSACKGNSCESDCRYCRSGIQLEYQYTPAYNNYYVEGIHQIYEKDCGTQSGWMYRVNGNFPNVGCSSYTVNDGDIIEWLYTCDLGEDVGNTY